MSPIGQRLRSGREEKGASRVDVSQETKIAVHHLAALEYSDFKELPDVVHVKGYVRAYAEYLGLEPTAVLEEFLAEYEAQCPAASKDPRDEVVRKMSKMLGGSQGQWARRLRPVAIVGALALVVVLVWMGWGRFGPVGESGTETTAPAAVEPSEAGSATAETPVETQDPTPERFVVFREPEPETPAPPVEAASEPVMLPPDDATAEAATPPPTAATATAEPTTPPPTAATPTAEAVTPAPAPASAARLRITQYGVGTGVKNRQLRGESDRFALGTKVAFFTRVEAGRAGDTIRHVWRHEGNEIASIPLRIGGANWRTYSLKTMHAGSAGAWTVEAVDESGNVLARSAFNCLP
ncbi:MAG: DUF2914 domain-containing protein [Deltaproteobacteria bacterium]|nr:DUF2914 domain-containing protein [Deltaproteobacteria bacterium]